MLSVFLRHLRFQRKEHVAALCLHGFRDLILHHSCLCTLSSGIFENMHLIEMDPFQILFCESKFFLRFPRKAHDYIGCNGRMVKDLS